MKNYILLLLTMIFWGLSWPVAKILVGSLNPFIVGFFRFLTASIAFAMVSIYLRNEIEWKKIRDNIGSFFLLGLTGIFGYGILFLVGLTFTTSAQGSIIAGMNPVSITVFTFLINKEQLESKWKYAGFAISFIGVIFVIGISALINFQLEYLIGNLIIFTSMLLWGIYSALGKRLMAGFTSFESTSFAVYFGMLLFGISSLFMADKNDIPSLDDPSWLGILFLGIFVTFLGFFFYFSAIQNIGATKSSIFINLVPIFGTISSYIFLNEKIIWTFIVGLILIIIGIIIINLPEYTDHLE